MHLTDAYLTAVTPVYRAEQVRAIDRYAIEQLNISGLELMTRAAQAAWELIQRHWPGVLHIAVVCGSGNNAGDAYIVARLAWQAGCCVTVYAIASPKCLHGDAATAYQAWHNASGTVHSELPSDWGETELLVDGLLGTGLDRAVSGAYATAIQAMNTSGRPILALDIPSGLHANTGVPLGSAVQASVTLSFIAWKRGLFTGYAADYVGHLECADLAVATACHTQTANAACLPRNLPGLTPRTRSAHKGQHGHVLVVGGDYGYNGAARMAAESAARLGAGLVSVATRAAHAALLNLGRPELMCHGVENADALHDLLAAADVVVLGPGLGRSPWAQSLWQTCLDSGVRLIVDADALNLLAAAPCCRTNWILTPHPGEAARLLGISSADVQRDRYAAVTALQQRYGGVVVLKGSGSLIGAPGAPIYICTAGNPGMGSGGMGDVLAGALGSLCAQGMDLVTAATYGVAVHAEAADRVAQQQGERGLLATDLIEPMRSLLTGVAAAKR